MIILIASWNMRMFVLWIVDITNDIKLVLKTTKVLTKFSQRINYANIYFYNKLIKWIYTPLSLQCFYSKDKFDLNSN